MNLKTQRRHCHHNKHGESGIMSHLRNKFLVNIPSKKLSNNSSKQLGFTLIELMIVIAIIGVVSAIAIPSYSSYLKKSRRADAKISLTKMADAQERWYLQRSTYSTSVADIGGADSTDGDYTLSAAAGTDGILEGFILTATADSDGNQADDDQCKKFILNSLGVKTSLDSDDVASEKCW